MIYSIGWPKALDADTSSSNSSNKEILQVNCDRVKILFAILYEDAVAVWYCKPCVPITYHRRDEKSLQEFGKNKFLQWKPDSSKLVIAVSFMFNDLIIIFLTAESLFAHIINGVLFVSDDRRCINYL